ncbi:hypothetical protein LCGC14_0124500 [marine sediment metagenome]|uniref:Uncharacterized protein n=1 Tax=marine sediment metagenome TaxID=412755 RepID=A0A0F9V5Z5_9ZZZZ|nr:hypothetical protein [Phycisphaerae bacterium]HDZ42350.1 hypothetical protein [Phycisphaerae bacterium]
MDTLDQCARDGRYPVTLHNYVGLGDNGGTVQTVDDWHELGITVGKTPAQSGGEAVPLVRAMLDRCAELGMMCFVNDSRCAGHVMLGGGSEDDLRRGIEAALKDYGDHPALMGFEVGDEPAQQKITAVFGTHGIQREMAPHLTPFLSIGGYSAGALEWMQIRSYGRYLEELAEVGKSRVFFHNNYALAAKDGENHVDSFFLTLKMYADKARQLGDIWTWVTLCCVPHGYIPDLNCDDIRWQINAAAACGFKGIAWYLLYMSRFQNYRNAPYNIHGRKTDMYWILSDQQREFNHMHGSTLAKLTFKEASFIGGAYGGWPSTLDSELVKAAKVFENEYPIIISEFKDADGRDYVSIVNNSGDKMGNALITWHGKPDLFQIGWDGDEYKPRVYFDDDWPENPSLQTCVPLAPGQMELFRVESDAPERL